VEPPRAQFRFCWRLKALFQPERSAAGKHFADHRAIVTTASVVKTNQISVFDHIPAGD